MSQTKPVFTRPVTKKPDDLAVPRLPGVCPARRLASAYRKADKKHPGLWMRLELTLANHAAAK